MQAACHSCTAFETYEQSHCCALCKELYAMNEGHARVWPGNPVYEVADPLSIPSQSLMAGWGVGGYLVIKGSLFLVHCVLSRPTLETLRHVQLFSARTGNVAALAASFTICWELCGTCSSCPWSRSRPQ